MKVLVIVALFAFVAVQVCQSAPIPEDVKVEAAPEKKAEPVAPAVEAAPAPAPEQSKPEPEPASDAPAAKAEAAPAAAPVEEKKD